jgi:hypothetical protein
MFVYLLKGSLPWQGVPARTDEERRAMIKAKKMEISVEELCEGLPDEFAQYIKDCRALKFKEKPNYAQLRSSFKRLFRSKGYENDNVYDWTERLFEEAKRLRQEGKI